MGDNGDEEGTEVPLGPAIGPVYEQWESALEKLKILHYETGYCGKGRKQFHRVHFVYPGANPGVQFDEFVDILIRHVVSYHAGTNNNLCESIPSRLLELVILVLAFKTTAHGTAQGHT